jgi:hypothetical protein
VEANRLLRAARERVAPRSARDGWVSRQQIIEAVTCLRRRPAAGMRLMRATLQSWSVMAIALSSADTVRCAVTGRGGNALVTVRSARRRLVSIQIMSYKWLCIVRSNRVRIARCFTFWSRVCDHWRDSGAQVRVRDSQFRSTLILPPGHVSLASRSAWC